MSDPQLQWYVLMATLREQLIQSILQMEEGKLPRARAFLHSLECGDSSPLSIAAEPPCMPIEGREGIQSGDKSPHSMDWPHAPLHRLAKDGTYIVTGGTLYKQHFFARPTYLDYIESRLLTLARLHGWHLEAWAMFSNHYHFIAHATAGCSGLGEMLKHLHGETATEINRLDKEPGRQVWFNYWDTQLTYEKSYLARLNYVHQNPVKHRLVRIANQYRWCSAAWFEQTASPAQVQTIYSFKTAKVNVRDDFDPMMD